MLQGETPPRRTRLLPIAIPLALAACNGEGLFHPKGPVAAAERQLLLNATGIMLVVILPVIVLTLGFAWRYRAGNRRATYAPGWANSGQIELLVWSIPAIVVILVGGVGWIGAHALDPYRKLPSDIRAIQVQVVALDWKWLFIYPELHRATVNDLTVPVGTPIEFRLTSATVMNAFLVPQLGGMVYAMPGMVTQLHLQADQVGDYPGLSSHFSGDGFSSMRFVVHAIPGPAFEAWAATPAPPLTPDAVRALTAQNTAKPQPVPTQPEPDMFDQMLRLATLPRDAPGAIRHGLSSPGGAQ